ncbi:hypothetical protein D3C72_1753300 [compost metagenome]
MPFLEATPQSVMKPTRLATVIVRSVKNSNIIPPTKAKGIVTMICAMMVRDLKWVNNTKAIPMIEISPNKRILVVAACWLSNCPP